MLVALMLLLPVMGPGDDPIPPPRMTVQAVRLNGQVTIDGIPEEAAWRDVTPFALFTQRDPVEGGVPGMKTEVRVAYDDLALYVSARMYDPSPDSIVVRLGRRDVAQNADLFQLYLDPYHDGRSGFYFGLDPAGTLYDGILYNDDWSDDSWDGVWEGKVQKDPEGWSAEMRIPFSQLRFREHGRGEHFRFDELPGHVNHFVVAHHFGQLYGGVVERMRQRHAQSDGAVVFVLEISGGVGLLVEPEDGGQASGTETGVRGAPVPSRGVIH